MQLKKSIGLGIMALAAVAYGSTLDSTAETAKADPVLRSAKGMIERGRQTFRHDTLGSESFFSGAIRLNEAIQTVTPRTALAVGLKVDSAALPQELIRAIKKGKVDLDDPATTAALLSLGAVVGVESEVGKDGSIRNLGITCGFCHSTVDDSVAPGIGQRLDGWANRDLNVGAILNLAPNLQPVADLLGVDVPTVKTVLQSWGPGRFDAHLNLDGKAFRPDGKTAAVLIPPAFGLAGVNLHTYEGWGSVTYWNAFVGNLEMNGKGTFFDPRLDDPVKHPVASHNGFADVRNEPDLITPKLADLHFYQLALTAPVPPAGSFDEGGARRGRILFAGKAQCGTCHVAPLFTEPGWNLHKPEEIGIDAFQADRGPEGRYRTTPLKGLWTHTKGGFYHDGRFPTLLDVVSHYDGFLKLGLSQGEKEDLVEYLKSL
ncbi:MAG: hypothetical protein QOH06_4867 [Acidobacteriota bacterium]|jgi:hypothetical protein|nr:hypothetical protein [Acidobacteriota bacterium]